MKSCRSDRNEDELFFLNFERILDMHIKIMLLKKNTPVIGRARGRINSEELSVSELRNN